MAHLPEEMDDKSYRAYDIKDKIMKGVNKEAHYALEIMEKDRTKAEFGITDQRIIIPSFGTTSKLFAQHFAILRDLRHKIDLLKQAYEYQRSDKRSWEQIDAILDVIGEACRYLDFPEQFEEMTNKAGVREERVERKKQLAEEKKMKEQMDSNKRNSELGISLQSSLNSAASPTQLGGQPTTSLQLGGKIISPFGNKDKSPQSADKKVLDKELEVFKEESAEESSDNGQK